MICVGRRNDLRWEKVEQMKLMQFTLTFVSISSLRQLGWPIAYIILFYYYTTGSEGLCVGSIPIILFLYCTIIFFFFASRLLFARRNLWSHMSYRNTNNRFFVHSSRIFLQFESILFSNVVFKNGKWIAYKYSLKYKYLIDNEIYSLIDETIINKFR